MTKVCLIDGSGYIFRAFYALPNMTAPDGTPVNAVYGFITMFMRLLKNIPCDYCVVLLDAKRENFRNEIFSEYKTNRDEVPEMLIPQFDLIHEAVKLMGLPYVLQEGYEADDLIATYAKIAENKGMEVVIVSADKDLMQLIRPTVSYYDGMKDKFFAPEDVKEKFGVYPDKVVDVQALSGDKTDNIPGIPGIGLKTAAELVNRFGSMQGVLDNVGQITQPKRREIIMQNREAAEISLKLVTLKDDVPVLHKIEEFKCHQADAAKLLAFADKLGFRSIRAKLETWIEERNGLFAGNGAEKVVKIEQVKAEYIRISDKVGLKKAYLDIKEKGIMAFKLLFNMQKTVGCSFCCDKSKLYYVEIPESNVGGDLFAFSNQNGLDCDTVRKFLKAVMSDRDILKVSAGLKFQWHLINKLCGEYVEIMPYDDVEVMSYDLDSSEHTHDINSLSMRFCDKLLAEPKPNGRPAVIDFENAEYAGYIYEVASAIFAVYQVLKQRLFVEHKTYVYERLDRGLIRVLLNMEERGITVNSHTLAELDVEFEKQLQNLEREIHTLAGEDFNINSPAQVGKILFEKMGLKGKKLPSGQYNTGAEVLEQLAEENEIAAKILEWRMYSKLKSTYTNALLQQLDANNRVHTTFSQTVVNTGRLASSNPNLQNIPNRNDIGRKIRQCFEAKKGYKLVAADYSQMELRLMAAVADVKALKEAFSSGVDIHAATAARVFNMPYEQVDREHRGRAKAINFGIIYGISQFGLAKQIGISKEQAKSYIDSYFAIMPEVKNYMEQTIKSARSYGFVLTPLGRKCFVQGINNPNHRIASFAERAAINAPIQGGAADIVKLAMQQIDRALQQNGYDAVLLLQVHDELVLEVREDQAEEVAKLVKNIMENASDSAVKMSVEVGIGDNWNVAH